MKKYMVTVNGVKYDVEVEEVGASPVPAQTAVPYTIKATIPAPQATPAAAPAAAQPAAPKSASGPAGAVKINAPMPGNILKISVSAGASVKRGDVLCLLEAMKMENEICAPQDGTVASINVAQGVSVGTGDLIMTLS